MAVQAEGQRQLEAAQQELQARDQHDLGEAARAEGNNPRGMKKGSVPTFSGKNTEDPANFLFQIEEFHFANAALVNKPDIYSTAVWDRAHKLFVKLGLQVELVQLAVKVPIGLELQRHFPKTMAETIQIPKSEESRLNTTTKTTSKQPSNPKSTTKTKKDKDKPQKGRLIALQVLRSKQPKKLKPLQQPRTANDGNKTTGQ